MAMMEKPPMSSARILLCHTDSGVPVYGPSDPEECNAIIARVLYELSRDRIEAILSAPTAQSLPEATAQEVAPTTRAVIGAGRQ